jgi:hypothetical protein
MRDADVWPGIADPEVCRYCRFRSICPDTTMPGEPQWPAIAEA